jgi:hypothetical protein
LIHRVADPGNATTLERRGGQKEKEQRTIVEVASARFNGWGDLGSVRQQLFPQAIEFGQQLRTGYASRLLTCHHHQIDRWQPVLDAPERFTQQPLDTVALDSTSRAWPSSLLR